MGKQLSARNKGFKRSKTSKKSWTGIDASKNQRIQADSRMRTSWNTSRDSSEEQATALSDEEAEVEEKEEEEEEEVIFHKEPTVYDNLLQSLGSNSVSLNNAYKRRQRQEEGKSDTEEDVESDLESFSASEEEDDGTDKGSSRSLGMKSNPQESGFLAIMGHSEDAGSDDDEAYKTDDENDLRVNGPSASEASLSMSSFSAHLDYKLSEAEVDTLSKRKWYYKWEVPAYLKPNCKWIGTGECFIEDTDPTSTYGAKQRLYKHWLDIYKASGGTDFCSSRQRFFLSLCDSYRDILHCNKSPFYLKGLEEDSSVMDAYLMHSLNHVFRTRDLVTKNDAKVSRHKENGKEEILNGDGFLDHGFTRPKILILLPLASIALRVVKRLIQLTPAAYKVNVEHYDRFSSEFGIGSAGNDEGDEGNDILKSQKPSKPSDFQNLFGGNNNDHFLMGIKFTRRSIKLYSDFYSSDMIVASPLGLITKIGEAEVEKEKDVDYLSSIEVLIIDHADVIAMQNWSHVNTVVEQLNRLPSKQHGTDIMRIRQWYLDGRARFYRQTIILGSYLNPEINALFNRHCLNYQGKVKLVCEHKGVLSKLLLQVRQIYERFDAESIEDAYGARLEYFAKKVFPNIKDSTQGGTMIFISSYLEFVRVRNFLKSQDASFCLLGEYTKQSDISRARVWFFQGRRKIMLYTERAHFYHRYKIRGVQNLIVYSLPDRKELYPELINMLEGSGSMTCTVLFSRFDQLQLERIVGTAPAKRMVKSNMGVFVFC